MAQFDVHANTGQSRADIPYVVVIQSRRFDAARTRLVAALRAAPRGKVPDAALTPRFRIDAKYVLLDPLQIVAIQRSSLGRLVTSLSDDVSSSAVINAIDAVITRAYG
jgi:toxin CcdB